ncbi:unnamed protein product [Allacma fusca]|uniref:Semialdehyde dehydrogenase NAD-binding domain-containing protein n=1 Tax=Allacma fusca TaxID=39272 RepID=A0A8J2JPX4_9HEXA|nr:unnamed protein product [Allacma fusca]
MPSLKSETLYTNPNCLHLAVHKAILSSPTFGERNSLNLFFTDFNKFECENHPLSFLINPIWLPKNMSGKVSAFIVGATGQVGKAISKELAKTDSVDRVTLFTRRQIDPSQGDTENDYSKFTVKVVDYEKLEENHTKDFEGFDIGYTALGLIGSYSNEEKKRVDHDYVLEAAKLAKAGGCNNLNVVTGGNADKDSRFFVFSNKGQIEHDVSALEFERVAFYRPGQLVGGERENLPLAYKLTNPVVKVLDCSRFMSCEVPVLAKVMVYNSLQPAKAAVEFHENREVHKQGIELAKSAKQ